MKTLLSVVLLGVLGLSCAEWAMAETATLTWTPSVSPSVTNHKIYRMLGPCALAGPPVLLATIGNVATYVDSTIPAGTPGATYMVTAVAGTQESAKSDPACKAFLVGATPTFTAKFAPGATAPRVGHGAVTLTFVNSHPTSVTIAGIAGVAATTAAWPTGALSTSFTLAGNVLTFNLCLSCFPADGPYTLTVTAMYPGIPAVTQTVAFTLGSGSVPVPPVSNLRVTQLNIDQTQIVATGPICRSIKTTGSGLKRVLTCVH